SCSYNKIDNCTISQNRRGIDIPYYSEHVTIKNSKITNNEYGIIDYGRYTLNNQNKYLTLKNNNISDNLQYGVYQYYSDFSQIENNTINGNGMDGLIIRASRKSTFYNNTMCHNGLNGIHLNVSHIHTIIHNTVSDNGGDGIYVYKANSNNVSYNEVQNNDLNGIRIISSSNNLINANLISGNGEAGILIDPSFENIVKDNIISRNRFGIIVKESEDNYFYNNSISNNDFGVYLDATSTNNLIYHNNFVDNEEQAVDLGDNSWSSDEGEGNYWSDYTGTDSDDDGIGDSSYQGLDENPLVIHWGISYKISDLVNDIYTMELSKGTENSLISKLNDAENLISKGNYIGAVHKLRDLIDYVEAQIGKKITKEQGDALIESALWIIYSISGY
ncbi:MAG: nitrous oxide reductase family maturation protein NosD, partial [Thermoplasmatota archaeon]